MSGRDWSARLEADWNRERTRRLAAEAERDALAAKVAAVEELAALWELAAMPPEQRLGPGYASERLRHALEADQ